MRRCLPVVLLVMSSALPALAQTPASPAANPPAASAPTPAMREAIEKQDRQMEAAAREVARLVDSGQAGQVWDGASAVTRRQVARGQFVEGVQQDRQRLGELVSRGQASIGRVQYAEGAAVPAGTYLNVSFATRFANSAQPVRELVSFRLDEDKVWRVSGYSLRAVGQ